MASNRTTTEVVLGTGALSWITSTGDYSAFPTGVTTPVGTIDGETSEPGFTELGYSAEGWAFSVDRQFEDVFVAEEDDPVLTFKTAQNITLTGTLSQASMGNIELALGGGTPTASTPDTGWTTYTPPATTDGADRLALGLVVPAPGTDKTRHIWIPSAVSTGAFVLQAQKAPQVSVIAIEFRITRPDASADPIFKIIDEV